MLSGSKRLLIAAALVYAAALTMASCSSSKPAPAPPAAGSLGRTEMKAVVSVKELMRYTIDPISDNVFDAVTYESTKKGVKEVFPKTDEDWEKVKIDADPVVWDAKSQALRNGALSLIEIADKRDTKELFEAGETLDKACEACHLE